MKPCADNIDCSCGQVCSLGFAGSTGVNAQGHNYCASPCTTTADCPDPATTCSDGQCLRNDCFAAIDQSANDFSTCLVDDQDATSLQGACLLYAANETQPGDEPVYTEVQACTRAGSLPLLTPCAPYAFANDPSTLCANGLLCIQPKNSPTFSCLAACDPDAPGAPCDPGSTCVPGYGNFPIGSVGYCSDGGF